MKENNDSWFLFQVYDGILDRWSPVYCAATQTAAILECRDMQKKLPTRPFAAYHAGMFSAGIMVPAADSLPFFENLVDPLEVKDEVSAAE